MEVRDGAGQDDDGVAHPLDAAKKFESLLVHVPGVPGAFKCRETWVLVMGANH